MRNAVFYLFLISFTYISALDDKCFNKLSGYKRDNSSSTTRNNSNNKNGFVCLHIEKKI